MKNDIESHFITITGKEDKKNLIEQYKTLIESLNKISEVRETANNFWTSINGALIGAIAYIRDSESMGGDQKPFLLFTLLFFGFILTLSWLGSLISVKKNVDVRNEMLIEVEHYLPAKIFTRALKKTGRKENWNSTLVKEMFVPIVFLAGYTFFGIILYVSPRILLSS